MSWSEVQGDIIVIPPERMKAKDGKAVEHLVPITAAIQEVIAVAAAHQGRAVPVLAQRRKRPLTMTGPMKADLDRRMLRTLRALARRRGEDHHAVELPPWVNHDLRRTIRSGLSALRVPHNVAEAVLAHRPPGIVGVYNFTSMQTEKREALEAMGAARRVHRQPQPAKVIKLRARRR